MRRLRVLLALCLSALLMACRPPAQLTSAPMVQSAPLLKGQLLLAEGFQAQANPGQVRANATVTLIDVATFQAKGTGITLGDGTFTVQALSTFTPTIGTLYLLQSSKTLGGAGSAAFRLRTLVQYTAAGWTSITGATIQLSTATTAVAILWDHHGLATADVLSKISYETTTRTHRFSNLTTTVTEAKVREVEALVSEALQLNVDPIQVVRPGPNGRYMLSMTERSRNRLFNTGFEDGTNTLPGWTLHNPAIASYSVETGTVYEASQSLRLTVNGAGDTWFGQGYNGTTDTLGLPMASGSVYTFSVYARGAAGGEKLAMCLNFQTPFFEAASPTFTLTTTWQRYTWTYVCPYNTDRAFFFFRNNSLIGQATFPATLYLDNVQFEEGGAATVYAPQGRLTLEGFANPLDGTNVTPTQGKIGRGVMVDRGINLLANSSFEVDSNSDGVPDGTVLTGTGGTYSLDTDALYGARSLKIVKATATDEIVRYAHAYAYKAGHTYTFSIWVKGVNVSGSPSAIDFGLYVDPFKVGGGYSNPDIARVAAPTGTFDWTRLSFTRTFINDCASANVYPIFRNKSGTVWFDGLQVEENSYAAPYAGDGPDRLVFDAGRYVNPQQGTIAFWYKPTFGWDDPEGTGVLMGMSNMGQDVIMLLTKYPTGDGRHGLRFGVRRETSTDHEWRNAEYEPTAPLWKPDEWHHVAVSWGPLGTALYLDGAAVATHPYNGPVWTTSSAVHPMPYLGILSFAGVANNFTPQISGALDDLKVWDAQRTPESVRREFLGLPQ